MIFGGRANVSEVSPDHPLAGKSIYFGQKLLDRSKPPSTTDFQKQPPPAIEVSKDDSNGR